MDYKCADGSYAFKKRTGCGLRLSESAENFDPGNGVRLFSSFYLVLLRFVHSFFGGGDSCNFKNYELELSH